MSPKPTGRNLQQKNTAERHNEMPDTNVQYSKAFGENLAILFDEIVLAEKWGRPSLLLAVHKSEIGQEKAEKELEGRLNAEGFAVVRLVFNDKRQDIAELIASSQSGPKQVYFVSNLDWGGGEDGRQAYRGLNLHRELFVAEGIKAVFWLSVNEAANLPRFAPDFWAFRHRVVEFVSQRAKGKVRLPAGILAWEIPTAAEPFDSPREAIAAREELLRSLPETIEAIAARVELHASLGELHWHLGEAARAKAQFDKGLSLAGEHPLAELKARILGGLGAVLFEAGDHSGALERFTDGLHFRSSSRVLLINASAANCVLGRIQEGLEAGQKAVRANPNEPDTWRRLGYIQNAAGRPDDAIESLARAAALAPRAPEHRISLAVLYSLIDRAEDAHAQLKKAGELTGTETRAVDGVIQQAVLGNTDSARELLAEAVAHGTITAPELQRDLNLSLLLPADALELAMQAARNRVQ